VKILKAPRMERCIGCNSCSLACARLVHKRLSWLAAGIRITSGGGLSTGFKPEEVTIPKRFSELTTWKGQTDVDYLNQLKSAYAQKINQMGLTRTSRLQRNVNPDLSRN
jgi:hypothetical protein